MSSPYRYAAVITDKCTRPAMRSAWWDDLQIDALEIAKGLWEQSRPSRAAMPVPNDNKAE